MKTEVRSLTLRVNDELARRTEEYNGREYLVVPVIALVEGVVFAGNADAPEFVPAEEITNGKVVAGFNGRPVFSGHPQDDGGDYVMGNSPDVLESKQIGIVFNAQAADGKLKLEAWIDVERVKEIEPDLLARIEANESDIEVSVGVFVDTRAKSGTHKGKRYAGVWSNIVPDHLAILPKGQTGACSVEAGCGVRAAHSKGSAMKATLFFRSAVSRDQMSDSDVRYKLYEALRAKFGQACGYVEAVYDTLVVFTVFDSEYNIGLQSVGFSLNGDGVVTLGEDVKKVSPRVVYDEVPESATSRNAADHACSCQKTRKADTGETLMKNISDTIKAALEAATPEQIAAVEAIFTPAAPAVATEAAPVTETPAATVVEETPVVETPAAAPAAEAAPVVATAAPTLAELLAAAAPEVRAAYDKSVASAKAAKAAAVKALRDSGRCDLSDEVLNGKDQAELDALVKLASANIAIETPATVDFSGQGVTTPRVAAEATDVPAPPDMSVSIRAARGVK